jgi:hypothetical protein
MSDLIFNIIPLPYIDKDGELLVEIFLDTNNENIKEKIKTLGYSWKPRFSLSKSNNHQFSWCKTIKFKNISDESEKVTEIGKLEIKENFEDLECDDFYISFAMKSQRRYNSSYKHKEDIIRRLNETEHLTRPKIPAYIESYQWNGKMYGKKDNYSVYLSGNKVNISNDQKEELEKYEAEMDKYMSEIRKIRYEYPYI